MNPHMSQRYPTNDRMLRFPYLPHKVFTDTTIDGTVSKCGNNISQEYGTTFGLTCLFPIKVKSDDHDTLPLLFKNYCLPPEMIMDNPKENFSSDFCKKLREANCHQKIIKPHSPWITAAEKKIRGFKSVRYRKMIKT